jgi:hypothetical protein
MLCLPLADAGITVQDVGAFWRGQDFDLELLNVNGRTLEGNCDLCFLKPKGQRLALIQAKPEAAHWWIRMESLDFSSKPGGARFRIHGPSYADLACIAASQQVVARVSVQGVVAAFSLELIVPGLTIQRVIADPAFPTRMEESIIRAF